MKRGVLVTACLMAAGLLPAGCSQLLTHSEQSQQAKQRWSHMRAKIKLQLAERSFENGSIDEAEKHCREVLALDPTYEPGFLLAARIHLEKGQVGKAVSVLEGTELIMPASAELAYIRGIVAERQGKLDEALQHFAAAYEMEPGDVDYLLGYVECLVATDQTQQAVEVIAPRRRDFEQTTAVHVLAGQAYSLLGRRIEAAECYRFAIELTPKNPLLREEAALAFLEAGWCDEAVDVLAPLMSAASDKAPTSQPAVKATPAMTRTYAVALVASGRPAQAGQTLDASLAEEPYAVDASLWLLSARAWLQAAQIDKAEAAARRTVELEPDQIEAHLVLAYCAVQDGRFEQAVEIAERLVEQNPQDLEARALLAGALERTPKGRAQAVHHYERILAIAPDHPWALTQLQRLTGQARLP